MVVEATRAIAGEPSRHDNRIETDLPEKRVVDSQAVPVAKAGTVGGGGEWMVDAQVALKKNWGKEKQNERLKCLKEEEAVDQPRIGGGL
ncbi:hypothetical protein N7490_004477 [Penicillium lividum]|nr:hypothetical protein N7490_004477 [Penicillium lividum]